MGLFSLDLTTDELLVGHGGLLVELVHGRGFGELVKEPIKPFLRHQTGEVRGERVIDVRLQVNFDNLRGN